MLKKIGYVVLGLILLLIFLGTIGVKRFNNQWFKETPNYLSYSGEWRPINFDWVEGTYGDIQEPHDIIKVIVRIEGFPYKLYMQFDTGAPSTVLYQNPLESLQDFGLQLEQITTDDKAYIKDFNFQIGQNNLKADLIRVVENYGQQITQNDTITPIKIGTIGTDLLDGKISAIDFKKQRISLFEDRPRWMGNLPAFVPFEFKGRRLLLPAAFESKKIKLFYDSGSSAFGLITSKAQYQKLTDPSVPEICYEANSWGNSIPICHKMTEKKFVIGKKELPLKRISYVDRYATFQSWLSPFTPIGGWLGNKAFTESILILDTKKQEFIIIEN